MSGDLFMRLPRAVSLPLRILSSKAFLLWMIGGWVLFYVTSAIWMKEAFAFFASGVGKSLIFQVPFVLFLVSGYCNLIRASANVLEKGKLHYLAWVVLPAGLLVFFTGFFVSLATRQFEWQFVGEGHTFRPRWESGEYTVGNIDTGMKDTFLDIGSQSGSGIFRYEPKMTIVDVSSGVLEVGAFPPSKADGTYFHIMQFGLAPGFTFYEGGTLKDEGYLLMRILGPGSSDSFEVPGYPYRFLLSLEPERKFLKGDVSAAEYNIRKPTYRVRVLKGEAVVAEQISREEIHFDTFSLRFLPPTFWVQLEMVKDPGVPLVVSGIFLTLLGIPLKIAVTIIRIHSKSAKEGLRSVD